MVRQLINQAYVKAKQMNSLWEFVTYFEKKFYHPGYRKILEANQLVLAGQHDEALRILDAKLPAYLVPAVEIVKANIARDNTGLWLTHVNAYLAHYGQAGIELKHGTENRLLALSSGQKSATVDGPLISVVMAAHNAARTIEIAMRSILQQSWRRVELIVVDDASKDDTWQIMRGVAQSDDRVKILQHELNAGPYVCKNMVLFRGLATGEYITCHDADDWAHPQRLEKHMELARRHDCLAGASITLRLRMKANGEFARIGEPRSGSPDGVCNVSTPATMFSRDLLLNTLGSWDSVRFGADSEIISRAEYFLGKMLPRLKSISMICLESDTSLSGAGGVQARVGQGLSPKRRAYKTSYERWQASVSTRPRLEFPPQGTPFRRPDGMEVPRAVIDQLINGSGS
jgi:Glycosyl transferase family 2